MAPGPAAFTCRCGVAITPADLVRAIEQYDAHHALFFATCAACKSGVELQLDRERVEWGYTYWAGSMHFEAQGEFRVTGLEVVERPEAEAVEVSLDDWSKRFPVPPAIAYVHLRRDDHAVGRTLAELELESLGVEVRGMQERGYVAIPVDRRRRLEAGMRLELFGPLSSRRNAERRLTKGP